MNDLDTLRPEVRETVFEIECRHNVRGWKTVRAELLRLTQENADLRSSIELNEQVWIQRNETMHKWIERARKAESELAALKARIAKAPVAECMESIPFLRSSRVPREWRGQRVALVKVEE